MKHLQFFESYFSVGEDGKLKPSSGIPTGAKKISLKEAFPGPVKKPYVGLYIKLNSDLHGVIIDTFERNGDWLFDIHIYGDDEVQRNLSWNRDYKTAFGDLKYGWSAFGENGEPNARWYKEIKPRIEDVMDRYGLEAEVRD